MKTIPNPDRPAHPTDRVGDEAFHANGLTKREWFAGMAMQGVLSHPESGSVDACARCAVFAADALLAELAKGANQPMTAADEAEEASGRG